MRRQWPDRQRTLGSQAQARAACDQNFELWSRSEQLRNEGSRRGHPLEVIHEDEHRSAADRRCDGGGNRIAADVANPNCQRDLRWHERGIGQCSKIDKARSSTELRRELARRGGGERGFTDTGSAGERNQLHVFVAKEREHSGHFSLAPDERCDLGKFGMRCKAAAARREAQRLPRSSVEPQCLRDQRNRNRARPERNAGFDVADGPRADAGPLGELFLRHVRLRTISSEELGKRDYFFLTLSTAESAP